MKDSFTREQRELILNGILVLVVLLLVLQLWLLVGTVNAFFGGDHSVVWPAALASLACLGANLGLLAYLQGLEGR